jgi:hypothetical protein
MENKKELLPEQREELIRVLKARFEKNVVRHKGLEWSKLQAKLEANTEKLWSLNEMKKQEVNRMLLVMIKRKTNTFFMIVQRKVQKAGEVFVTTAKLWSQGKNINRKITLLIWLLPCALNFYRKNNIESCRNLEISILKRRAG